MGRKLARESSMTLLYQMELLQDFDIKKIDSFYESNNFSDAEKTYISEVTVGVLNNIKEIDQYIKNNMDSWSIDRLAKIDLSILRISVYEILYRDDIPNQVSINEAIESAKKYSTEESSKFINGILGGAVKEIEKLD